MKLFNRLLFSVSLGVAVPTVAMAQCPFSDYQAIYNLTAGSASGTVEQALKLNSQNQYQIASVTVVKFMFFSDQFTQNAQGKFKASYFHPSAYDVVDTKKNQPWVVFFKPMQGTLVYLNKKQNFPLPTLAQDNLSYQLQLRLDLLNGQTTFSYPVVYGDANKQAVVGNYVFTVVGNNVPVNTDLGQLQTIELQRQDPQTKITTLFWFAPKLNDLMVRNEVLDANGEVTSNAVIHQYTPGNSAYCIPLNIRS